MDGNLWTKATVTADWVKIPDSGNVVGVIEVPSNYL
jgi:hypothetical protein